MVVMPTETETICKELTKNFLFCFQTVLVLPELFAFAHSPTISLNLSSSGKKWCSHFCCVMAAQYLIRLTFYCLRQGSESESTGYFVDMEDS